MPFHRPQKHAEALAGQDDWLGRARIDLDGIFERRYDNGVLRHEDDHAASGQIGDDFSGWLPRVLRSGGRCSSTENQQGKPLRDDASKASRVEAASLGRTPSRAAGRKVRARAQEWKGNSHGAKTIIRRPLCYFAFRGHAAMCKAAPGLVKWCRSAGDSFGIAP